MNKSVIVSALSLTIAGCGIIDPIASKTEIATVVAVDQEKGQCTVTFQLEGDKTYYASAANTPYKKMRCESIKSGQAVPVVVHPIIGNYPYVLFESIEG